MFDSHISNPVSSALSDAIQMASDTGRHAYIVFDDARGRIFATQDLKKDAYRVLESVAPVAPPIDYPNCFEG